MENSKGFNQNWCQCIFHVLHLQFSGNIQGFYWFWTLLSILAVLTNAVVSVVSTHLPTFKPASFFSNPLVTVPNAPITIGIIVICIFHSFFQFPIKVEVLILLFTFYQFYSVVSRDGKVDYFESSHFFFLVDYY